MAVVLNDFVEQAKKYYSTARATAKENENLIYDEQEKVTTDTYNTQISDTETAYEDSYRENAVQKLINERQVAESMANMGLTDSGLNRTQQTAVQLSYANNKAKLDRQKQAQVDALALNLATELSAIKQNRLASLSAIDKEYDGYVTNMANTNYATAKDAETAAIQAQEKASYIIQQNDATLSKAMQGSFSDNGISVKEEYDEYGAVKGYTYVDNNSGKSSYFARGINPFTGTTNDDVKNGTFKNGYQPNNVGGKKLIKSVGTDIINGNEQNVWMSSDGKLWIWDGRNNEYLVYDANDE